MDRPLKTSLPKCVVSDEDAERVVARARVVLDTNLYISALLWTGISHRLLRLGEAGDVMLVTTPAIMEELREVLRRPKFKLHSPPHSRHASLALLSRLLSHSDMN